VTHPPIEQEVIQILRQTSLAGSDREINMQDPIGDLGLGLDSLALVEFVTALEKRFQMEMPDDIWSEKGQLTVQHFVEAVAVSAPSAIPAEPLASPGPGLDRKTEAPATLGRASGGPQVSQPRMSKRPLGDLPRRIRRFCHQQEHFMILAFEPSPEPLPAYVSPLSLTLREATPADADALQTYWRSFPYETVDQERMTMALFQERLTAGSCCLTAWHEDRIVGMDWLFSKGYRCPYTGLEITWPRDVCYGGELYEHEDYHGKGVGLALLAFSLAETSRKGLRRQVTLVSAKNIKMLGASIQYLGLKVIGEIHTTRFLRHPFSTWRVSGRSGRGGRIEL
jgi:acyl carrier protein/GNAT superfamily N-acetyltransferase